MKSPAQLSTFFTIYFFDHDSQSPQSVRVNEYDAAKQFYVEAYNKLKRDAKSFSIHMSFVQIQYFNDETGAERNYWIVGHTERGAEATPKEVEVTLQRIRKHIKEGTLILDKQGITEKVPQGTPLYADGSTFCKTDWMDLQRFKEHMHFKDLQRA